MPVAERERAALGQPAVDLLLQDVERHRAVAQHDVVEIAHVEVRAQRPRGTRAQRGDVQLPYLVRQRLAGPSRLLASYS